ncbi:hypothetical protein AB1Y20_009122 [Prymnesium parvum]|uniref:Uncharacterized protein n=1 Tax=Prymnesium parvum TaxID=97485 RepID=A0AB34K2X7_PRYPA
MLSSARCAERMPHEGSPPSICRGGESQRGRSFAPKKSCCTTIWKGEKRGPRRMGSVHTHEYSHCSCCSRAHSFLVVRIT